MSPATLTGLARSCHPRKGWTHPSENHLSSCRCHDKSTISKLWGDFGLRGFFRVPRKSNGFQSVWSFLPGGNNDYMSQPLHGYFQLKWIFFQYLWSTTRYVKFHDSRAPPGRVMWCFMRLLCLDATGVSPMDVTANESSEVGLQKKMHNTYRIPQRFLSQKILKYEFRFIYPTEQDIRSSLVVQQAEKHVAPWYLF